MAERLHILFICSMNRWRSPTAETLYARDPRFAVRSAGTRPGANRCVSAGDLRWADAIFVMEEKHRAELRGRFRDESLPPITVLDVPDEYRFMDRELQRLLRDLLDPALDELRTRRTAGRR